MFQEDFQPSTIAPPLLEWFDAHRRDLPWRHTRDPYRVWLSEIMLQQTQVVTVIPYYERFLLAFPTVEALAAAPVDEVLRLWEGLGYYSRARNLHRAAQRVVAEFGGHFPRTATAALALPGIGRYTAGAILSIAFGVALPALDGNALRVLSRLLWLPGGGREGEEKRRAEAFGHAAVPADRPGDYNQAMMELGATVCTPRAPGCARCPLADRCEACRRGEADAVPVLARAASRTVAMAAAVVWRGGKLLIAQRPPTGVWAGLWELPNCEVPEPAQSDAARECLTDYLKSAFGLRAEVGQPLFTLTHGIMNRRIRLTVYAAEVTGGRLHCGAHEQAKWVPLSAVGEYALPAPHRKIVLRLSD